MPSTATKPTGTKPVGISAGQVLPTEEYKSCMGLGQKAWVKQRLNGLPTHKIGRRLYVFTDEAIAWMQSRGSK